MKRNQDFALFFNIALISDVIYCGKPLSTYMGEVSGQATRISTSKVIAHIVSRFNHVHSIWEETDKSKKTHIIYTKYELRHFVISFLRDKDYESIEYFFNNLSPSILSLLLPYENIIYRSPWLNPISKIHILFTKLIWRFHGFGVVV